jgi:hypothetical protein
LNFTSIHEHLEAAVPIDTSMNTYRRFRNLVFREPSGRFRQTGHYRAWIHDRLAMADLPDLADAEITPYFLTQYYHVHFNTWRAEMETPGTFQYIGTPTEGRSSAGSDSDSDWSDWDYLDELAVRRDEADPETTPELRAGLQLAANLVQTVRDVQATEDCTESQEGAFACMIGDASVPEVTVEYHRVQERTVVNQGGILSEVRVDVPVVIAADAGGEMNDALREARRLDEMGVIGPDAPHTRRRSSARRSGVWCSGRS